MLKTWQEEHNSINKLVKRFDFWDALLYSIDTLQLPHTYMENVEKFDDWQTYEVGKTYMGKGGKSMFRVTDMKLSFSARGEPSARLQVQYKFVDGKEWEPYGGYISAGNFYSEITGKVS